MGLGVFGVDGRFGVDGGFGSRVFRGYRVDGRLEL